MRAVPKPLLPSPACGVGGGRWGGLIPLVMVYNLLLICQFS